MREPKIITATVGPMPKSLFDPMPSVTARFDDGTERVLFSFYPDEITFTESELVGLTAREAGQLRYRKDKAYLQS
jgi:hypothetical protein